MGKHIDVAALIGTPSALTQEGGDALYAEIMSAFEKREKIEVDFTNIESMISPFLNKAIGQLYEHYTSDFIKEYLSLKNFPKTKISTLNLVISNAKNYYANKEKYTEIVKDVVDLG